MRDYDFKTIQKKWQERWDRDKTFSARTGAGDKKLYCLEMFPYPSGSGLHVGHLKNYVPTDCYCRYKSMMGYNVMHPMGWDAFGQPAENEALRTGRNPREMVPEYVANYKRTLKFVGCSYDWQREVNSSHPNYYRWTQWFFLFLFHRGLAYRATAPINWCPSCKTGLANEEVKEGRCWRCDTPVEKRPMPQWFFKITTYADRLLKDLDNLNWPEGMKEMQRDWIGRSEGAEVDFAVKGHAGKIIKVFTTRPDTLFGATFMVLAPEHPLVSEITTAEQQARVAEYVKAAQAVSEMDRLNAQRSKTGVFTGAHAVNPVNGREIPIWIADYVLLGYGTGAIMAVPGQDQRDWDFAQEYDLPIIRTVQPPEGFDGEAYLGDGPAINSDFLNGLLINDAVKRMNAWLEEKGCGHATVTYRIRDWLISRQRYWGAPIPIIHCPKCGIVPVPEKDLPVLLPEVGQYMPSGTGESPLAMIPEFVNTKCPGCGGPARRETDTMGGYACSSWYFFRFTDPGNDQAFAGRPALDYWMPIDLYTGGVEHARSHLLYSRFWTKVLFDAGLVGFEEPFLALRNQGSLLAYTPGRRPRLGEVSGDEDGAETILDWIVLRPEERDKYPADQIVWRWVRMSKSKGNVVTPEEMAEKYGVDTLRIYIMFLGPFEDNVMWNENGVSGSHRFVLRAWRWINAALETRKPGWRHELAAATGVADLQIRRKLHQTIAKVGGDIDGLQFNTAIAALMELLNDVYQYAPLADDHLGASGSPAVVSEIAESLTLMLAPFTPHLAEELWHLMGNNTSVYRAPWPAYDAAAAAENMVTVVFQVNGKVRATAEVTKGLSQASLTQTALQHEKVKTFLSGKTVVKTIVVPDKLVNIVVR